MKKKKKKNHVSLKKKSTNNLKFIAIPNKNALFFFISLFIIIMTYSYKFKLTVVDTYIQKILKVVDIINIFQISKSSLFNWINKFKNNNLIQKTIRNPKFSMEIKCYIRYYVCNKINFKYKLLIKNIKKKYKVNISKSSIYNILKKMKIKRKKIYKRHSYLSKSKRSQLFNEMKNKIKNTSINKIISIDETSIDNHLDFNYGWGKVGKKIIKKLRKYKIRYTLICAITNKKVIHYNIIKGSANGNDFNKFIKELNKKINGKFVLFMDNARIHHYKPNKEYIETNSNLDVIFNLPYSPEYNPIELFFNQIKTFIKNKSVNRNAIKKNISDALQNTNHLNSYYTKALSQFF